MTGYASCPQIQQIKYNSNTQKYEAHGYWTSPQTNNVGNPTNLIQVDGYRDFMFRYFNAVTWCHYKTANGRPIDLTTSVGTVDVTFVHPENWSLDQYNQYTCKASFDGCAFVKN